MINIIKNIIKYINRKTTMLKNIDKRLIILETKQEYTNKQLDRIHGKLLDTEIEKKEDPYWIWLKKQEQYHKERKINSEKN